MPMIGGAVCTILEEKRVGSEKPRTSREEFE